MDLPKTHIDVLKKISTRQYPQKPFSLPNGEEADAILDLEATGYITVVHRNALTQQDFANIKLTLIGRQTLEEYHMKNIVGLVVEAAKYDNNSSLLKKISKGTWAIIIFISLTLATVFLTKFGEQIWSHFFPSTK